MWQIVVGDAGVIALAAIHAGAAWRRRSAFHRRLREADQAIAYSWVARTFVVGVVIIWGFVLTTSGALGAHSDSLFESVPVNAVALLALVAPIWVLAVEFFGTEYHVAPEGLRKHSPWTGNFDVRWDEIEAAEDETSSGWLVIRTKKGKIRIHSLIRGRWKVSAALDANVFGVEAGL